MSHLIVTISNTKPSAWYYLQEQFFESVKGQRCMVIQGGGEYGYWKGLATKPKWLYKAIKDGAIKEDYMIFVDNWDLVFAAKSEEVIEKYKTFDTDIVISSELNCFPVDLKDEFDRIAAPTDYKYLNSGCIVGKTDAILACLEAMDLPNMKDDYWDEEKNCNFHANDQFEWMKIFFKQPVSIALDYYQSICQTLHNTKIEDFDFSGEKIRNVHTNTTPCIIHFNGGSKDNLSLRNPILNHLKLL